MNSTKSVVVIPVPENLTGNEAQGFLQRMKTVLQADRRGVVLDCSQVCRLDSTGLEVLLHCLEEAMKRDGELKLAAVSPAAGVILEMLRASDLFDIYATLPEAIASFDAFASCVLEGATLQWNAPSASERGASYDIGTAG